MGYIDAQSIYQKNKNYKIYFTYVPKNITIEFPAIVRDFKDQFTSTHIPSEVYGRMDPIYTFQRTVRQITCGFDCIGANKQEVLNNLYKLNQLITFLYPTYLDSSDASTISSPPLFRIKMMNLIYSAKPPASGSGEQANGLLGYVGGFTYEPPFVETSFLDEHDFIGPIKFPIKFNFKIIHEHDLGWGTAEEMGFTTPGIFGGSDLIDNRPAAETAAAETAAAVTETADAETAASATGAD